MDDYTITLPYPFAMGGMSNFIICQSCGWKSYASDVFGVSETISRFSTYGEVKEWVQELEDPEEGMVCPTCGARKENNLGRRVMNFMIGESAREHIYPRRVAVPV